MHATARLRIAVRKAVRPGLGQVPVASLAIVGILAAPAGPARTLAPTHRPAHGGAEPTVTRHVERARMGDSVAAGDGERGR